MTVSAQITAEVAALNSAFLAIGTIETASTGSVTALANQAEQLVNDVETDLVGVQPLLDTFMPPVMPPALVQQVLDAETVAETQLSLADLRGVSGRIASNLANA